MASNYTTSAQVVVSINGRQAQQMMSTLDKEAKRLEQQIARAAAAGDKVKVKQLNAELNRIRRIMDQLNGSANSVEQTLARLDRATPKELNRALQQLQRQLNGIERGSEAWNRQMAQIRRVREEINRVNAEMRTQESGIGRLQGWFDKWSTSIMAAAAALAGIVEAGRAAVKKYADMEQEMANVRKYTGLTADEVERLNEEFKKMDTRSSREDLNKMAQEAGRLGKQSLQDVLGYVKAADKINVALDDLGEGATLTLSKLAGIFGEEKRLGTEKALLSIGSVVNELSQNCSASAPYLTNFASRMGGVGQQAGLTIQQIMALGAVLDSNNQKCEAAATAVSQVMVRIYQQPAKYAKVAGLDVTNFTNLVKKDMNAAFLTFLETLNKAGSMEVLSPMFREMGENGARAIAALSTLAGKIDEVKWQQANANEAFAEATSIGKEFDVQNNTVLAGIEKGKKRIAEVSVELGEKLQPVMSHVISSTSMMLKAISFVVDVFLKFRYEIITAVAAIAAYNAVMLVHNTRTAAAGLLTKAWGAAVNLAHGVLPVLKLGVAAATNAVEYFTNGLRVNYAMQQRWRTSMEAMKFSHWTGLIVALAGAVYLAWKNWEGYGKEMREIVRTASDMDSETREEIKNLDVLFGKLDAATKGTEAYDKAKQDILDKYGAYLGGLVSEQGQILDLEKAYDRLTLAVRRSAMERRLAKASESLNEQYDQDIMKEVNALKDNLIKFGASARDAVRISTKVMQSAMRGENPDYETRKEIAGYSDNVFSSASAFGSWLTDGFGKDAKTPASSLMAIQKIIGTYHKSGDDLRTLEDAISPLHSMSDKDLLYNIEELEKKINYVETQVDYLSAGEKTSVGQSVKVNKNVDMQAARSDLEELKEEAYMRGLLGYAQQSDVQESEEESGSFTPTPKPTKGTTTKTDKFKEEKEWKEQEEAKAQISYYTGETDYREYQKRLDEIAIEYADRRLAHTDLTETERLKITAEREKELYDQSEARRARSMEEEEHDHQQMLADLKQFYLDGKLTKEAYDEQVTRQEIMHQMNLVDITREGTKERTEAEMKLESMLLADKEKKQKQTQERIKKIKDEFFGLSKSEAAKQYADEMKMLNSVYETELVLAGNSAREKLRIERNYLAAVEALKKKYALKGAIEDKDKDWLKASVAASLNFLKSDAGKAITQSYDVVVSGMTGIFSQVSAMMESELELQTAAIEKRYDAELSRAEGNAYRIKAIEQKKEKEIADAKTKANRKMFAMQVIQAIAQTATNALNAYGSAAAIPVVGHIMAPIAAAMAVAAGMVQVAAIKKQQQASEAQGYAEGGFTKPGKKYEPAGVVHAGEWVASQELVNSPVARPLIDALEYAQRTNTVGRLSAADVSRTLTAPMVIAHGARASAQSAQMQTLTDRELTAVISRLSDRLDEPFVTVTTIDGDYGVRTKWREYDRYIANKSPKK